VQCVERAEIPFCELPGTIRLGALRNNDLLREQQHLGVKTTFEDRIAA